MKTTLQKLVLFAVATAFTTTLSAQSISYKITKDDPFDIKNASLAIDPLFFDVQGQNGYAFGWGLRADYLFGKTFQFKFDMRQGFGTNGYNMNDANTKNYFAMEGAVGLIISNKTLSNLPIILSSSSSTSGNTTTTTTISIAGGVPGTVRKMVMLEGGIYQMGNSLNYKNLDDSLLTFENKSTSETFALKDAPDSIFADGISGSGDRFGGVSSTALFAGFNFKKINNLQVQVDGYGWRANRRYVDFYMHIIFAPVMAARNYTSVDGTEYNLKYDNNKRIGWRMGWMFRKPKDQGFSAKFEFGQRPGLGTYEKPDSKFNFKNMYMMFTYGLYIPVKVEPVVYE